MPARSYARLNKEFVAAMGRPDVQAAMEKQAFVLTPSTPERLAAYVKEQLRKLSEHPERGRNATGVTP